MNKETMTNSPYASYRVNDLKGKLYDDENEYYHNYRMDIMVVGATGVGKSTTLNALLSEEQAKVGYIDPETQDIQSYILNDYICLWDTPGLGDDPAKDAVYLNKMVEVLQQRKRFTPLNLKSRILGATTGMIDLVLVLVHAGSRDLGTVYTLLNTLSRYIEPDRILLAVNQADVGMSGKHWQGDTPDTTLTAFLNEKAESIQRRVLEETGKQIKKPICYSAEYQFNLYSLLDYIINNFDYEDIQYRSESEIEKGAGWGCFITTAVCESFQKPDDCYELTMFRGFRDNYLLQQPDGKQLITEYYQVAPKIVEAIDKTAEKDRIYTAMWEQYLAPCLSLIEAGRLSDCKERYIRMVETYKERFLCGGNGLGNNHGV